MTVQVCVLGIDGSGKSTVVAGLPRRLADLGLVASSLGDVARARRPPLLAKLSVLLKRLAKRVVHQTALYPLVKVTQLLVQDAAALTLAERPTARDRERAVVVVSDGNALLSAMGRLANYRVPASRGQELGVSMPTAPDLEAVLGLLVDGAPLPADSAARLPSLAGARGLLAFTRLIGLRCVLLPDVVVLLDVTPARALARIEARGQGTDPHENLADLAQARAMYRRTLEAYRAFRPQALVVTLPADDMTPDEVIGSVVDRVLRSGCPAAEG